MKKYLFTIIIILSMLAMFTGTVAAAGNVKLVSVIFVPGKGPVFTFEVSGEYSNADLKGALHVVGGADFDLHCTQVDSSTVKCTSTKKAAGRDVVLSWGGATFWTFVPPDPELYCYGIYDWTPTVDSWMLYGRNCQKSPAEYFDAIDWDNPEWGPSPYWFLPGSPGCFAEDIIMDAYYFPGCPF